MPRLGEPDATPVSLIEASNDAKSSQARQLPHRRANKLTTEILMVKFIKILLLARSEFC